MCRTQQIAALAAATASYTTLFVTLSICKRTKPRKKRSHNPPKSKRRALIRLLLHVPTNLMKPWKRIFSCGSDDDYLISVNVTKELLIEKFLPYFAYERGRCNYGSPYRRGSKSQRRPAQLKTVDLLGLSMWYLKTKATAFSLCPSFDIVPSSISVWLDYALEVVLRVVKRRFRSKFEVRWPTEAEMRPSASLLDNNRTFGPLLKDVFAVTDGGRMPCADYTDVDLQNAYFEGFTQNVEVTTLFVWNFHGEIIHAAINYPGSWNDTKLAGVSGLYYPKLSDEMTPPGFAILGESAFVNNYRATNGKVLRGRKANEVRDIPESAALAAVMPSERQSAEWGVRSLKGPFQRLKTPLPADTGKRLRLLRICCHPFNFRTRFVGLNQLRTTYSHTQTAAIE